VIRARPSSPGAAIALAVGLVLTAAPTPASAHSLAGRLDSPLPLVAYLAGAAAAVALSFVIAYAYKGRWNRREAGSTRTVPRAVVAAFRLIGVVAWSWIVVQLIIGGSSDAAVGSLFTWVYGWIGLALVSALLGPVWGWLDPFSTFYDVGTWALRRLGVSSLGVARYPRALAAWPAVVMFTFFVWLELAVKTADMGPIVVGYTGLTLAGMAYFGKVRWRRQGEVFSVWFGLLGRLARYAPSGPPERGRLRRQRFPDGLLGRPWDISMVTLVAVATGAILYDGLSQTQLYFDLFGLPDVLGATWQLGALLAIIVAAVLWVAHRVGATAMGAGLLPIAFGYLIAHNLTSLLADGQRIVIAASDPFQLGWDLFDTAFYEPTIDWLPISMLWFIVFASVVGGHVIGAWTGHLASSPSDADASKVKRAQLPLAVIMVTLTTLTLWSLGQSIIREDTGGVPAAVSAGASIVLR